MYNVKIYSKSNLQPSNLLMLLFYDSNSNPTFLNHSSIVPKPPIGNISPDSLPFTDSKRKPTPPRMEKVTNTERERERERESMWEKSKSHMTPDSIMASVGIEKGYYKLITS